MWVVRSCGCASAWGIGMDRLVDVCDRQSDRIQAFFDRMGNFKSNIGSREEAASRIIGVPHGGIGFSPDRVLKYLYVDDGGDEQMTTVDHVSAKFSQLRRPGHQIGIFTHGHTLAVDCEGIIMWPRPTGAEESKNSCLK